MSAAVLDSPPRRPPPRHPLAAHRVTSGSPYPLGAVFDRDGVNFAVHSSRAEKIEVCLYAKDGRTETERIALSCTTNDIWHGHVKGLRAGQLYGLRVHGPYDPATGLRFNPAKLLLDPYARALDRPLRGQASQFGYPLGHADEDLARDEVDNGRDATKCRVVRSNFHWGDDAPPCVPPQDTVFYEVHVKGFTKQLPGVPEPLRGTYAGLAAPAAIAHLKGLGITSVELLPVQAFMDDKRLVDHGLCNYWGYSTAAYFAPEPRYSSSAGDEVNEFKGMVRALHANGLEVILDVVYNHTCEGNHLGPTLSLKGIDNPAYYRLAADPRFYIDYTGTGHTLDTSSPPALRLMLDSLRYWVTEMHVDGFRFDLASSLGRNAQGQFDHRAAFFAALAQDPVLARVKLIGEPWDLGEGGYQVGGFPPGWQEWNGRYRDAVRDYWRNADGSLPAFAASLCGSADIFQARRRPPWTGVNIVTVHDGFTLADLVGYNEKHNEANGEDNRDGESHNRSWNCGAEGPSDDPEVCDLRERQVRNFLATLFVSHGVPLLLGGDEMGRTQGGNNNGYCQDNTLSWYDWSRAAEHAALTQFVRALTALRRELAPLRPSQWPAAAASGEACPAIEWHSVWGQLMTLEEWDNPEVRCVAALIETTAEAPEVMLLFNATPQAVLFTLCKEEPARSWTVRMDTRTSEVPPPDTDTLESGDHYALAPHTMALLTTVAKTAP